MPTFILIKRGKEVDKVVGAKKEDLQKKIDKHRFWYAIQEFIESKSIILWPFK